MPDIKTDEEVMMLVKEGNSDMLAVLFERYHLRLFNFVYRLSGNKAVSEDTVQEIFFRILKYRMTYQEKSKFAVWLYRIARNIYIDYLYKIKKDNVLMENWHSETFNSHQPDEILAKEQEINLLNRALNQLSFKKKEVLMLSRFQNLKYKEIAELLECSVESVKTNVHRAVKELSKKYHGLQEVGNEL